MNTLAIISGDFSLSGGTFKTLTGIPKIKQDLGIASLTPYGSNQFHPKYGSVLGSYIGSPVGPSSQAVIQGEVKRLISNYQNLQIAKMNSYVIQGFRSPYGQNDLIRSIQSIEVTQHFDSFHINATLTTMSGQTVQIASTISASQAPVGL